MLAAVCDLACLAALAIGAWAIETRLAAAYRAAQRDRRQ